MKRFIFSILCVAVFFIGLGALVEKTGAKFKSDEKALALIAKARQAIGGDSAVSSVKSLSIVGRATRSFKIDGAVKSEESETEIALQLPDQMMKMVKGGHGDGYAKGMQTFERTMNVVVTGDDKDPMKVMVNGAGHGEGHGEGAGAGVERRVVIKIKKDDGTLQELTGAEAEKWIAEHPGVGGEHTIIIRKGVGDHAEFKSEGGNVILMKKADGTVEKVVGGADSPHRIVVESTNGGNVTFRTENGKTIVSDGNHIMLNREGGDGMRQNELLRTTLGLLLTAPAGIDINYTYGGDGDVDGTSCDVVVAEFGGSAYKLYLSEESSLPVMMSYKGVREPQVFTFMTAAPKGGDEKQNMVFTRKVNGQDLKNAEFNVKFSDYRAVNGVQLPYKWTQTVGGEPDEHLT